MEPNLLIVEMPTLAELRPVVYYRSQGDRCWLLGTPGSHLELPSRDTESDGILVSSLYDSLSVGMEC